MRAFFAVVETPRGRRLAPTDASGEKVMERLKAGAVVACDVRVPRDNRLTRKYWALIGLLADQLDLTPAGAEANVLDAAARKEIVSGMIKMGSGHFVKIPVNGCLLPFPLSISHAAMGQKEFDDFFSRALDSAYRLCGKMGVRYQSKEELLAAVEEFALS